MVFALSVDKKRNRRLLFPFHTEHEILKIMKPIIDLLYNNLYVNNNKTVM